MWKSVSAKAAGCLVGIYLLSSSASAIEINGYSPARHDRFASGYPSAPVANTDSSFIGLGYDWSGVGWNSSDSTQSVALLGPGFFLYANHYPVGSTLQFFSSDGQLKSYSVNTSAASGPIDNNSSDLGVGVLTTPIPASDHVTYYPILFLGYSANSYYNDPNGISGYNNILVYGREGDGSNNGPRIGKDTITYVFDNGVTLSDGSNHSGKYFYYSYDTTTADLAHIETGDSGSPSFFYNSDTHQLYLAGAHFAADQARTQAIDSALPLMLNYVDAYMAQTGYLPYVVTPSTATWNGANGLWGTPTNWSAGEGTRVITGDTLDGITGQVTTCASLVFDGSSSTASRSISLGGVQRTVTGITFKSASGANAFTFNPGGTGGSLRIGEAGIVNNDDDTQILNCNIVLRSSQRWSVGQGGLSVSGSIDTDTGDLLLIEGNGNTTLSGVIFGSGGIAKDGSGTLTLGGISNNTYTGKTFVNGGTLKLGNSSALGTTAGGTIVQNGGALDLNGLTIGYEPLTIGNGSSGIGALINSNTSATAVFNGPVTLGGNAGAGGSGNITLNGYMNYGTYAFTKNGTDTLTFTGPQIWGNNAVATVEAGTLSYQLAVGATATVGASTPTLHITSGAVVNVNATNYDPFTDLTTPTQHVQIINDASGSFNLTAGTSSLAGISGGGSTSIQGGAVLYSNYISQGQLTIGAGSTGVTNSISGSIAPLALSADSSSTLPISDLASLNSAAISPLNTLSESAQSDANITDAVPVISGFSSVPEPSTWILIVIGALCLLCRRKRK